MKGRPFPVITVAILFILAGSLGLIYHIQEFFKSHITDWYESVWVLILRVLAIVCGVLLLFRIKWARWLAILWMSYHIAISALHSVVEMFTHIVLLIIISILLFLPISNKFFQKK
ncbi:hypothetical protein C7S20_06425 [Christiangramia fulva]|uniref:DoxX family protein n=1 Tax=Christiangramia fulva TaxID=2126553 RepID=A0A2R3Z3T2_9FLAO|nr:hypothetical protein [Christiangramia fulva]AVR44933.1 hypothetical protein C7S20_06425 [Christiangramia fulva]